MKYQGIIIIRRITIIGPNNIISIMVGVLRNNTKTLEKKTEESWNNSKHRVTSKKLHSWGSTNTQKGTRYWIV